MSTARSSQIRCYIFMYSLGSVLYSILELLYRGHTHFSMVITGGLCGILLYGIHSHLRQVPLWGRALIGCFFITLIELIFGCLVNRLWHWAVWDYHDQPFNLFGQICLRFSFYWFLLCFPAFLICHFVRKHLPPCLNGPFLFYRTSSPNERILYGENQNL